MQKKEEYIAIRSRIHSRLQWIHALDEGFKLLFDFLKKKVPTNMVLRLHNIYGSLPEDPDEIKCMVGLFLQIIFSCYTLMDSIVVVVNSYYKVIPHKVYVEDWNMLQSGLLKDGIFDTLCLMYNGKSIDMDGFLLFLQGYAEYNRE